MKPTEGFFCHGGSENKNQGPIRCACLDLASGEVIFDEEYKKNNREEMLHGTCFEAATISILSAIIVSQKAKKEEVKIYSCDPVALRRVDEILEKRKKGLPLPDNIHPLIAKAVSNITSDKIRFDMILWNKREYGANPFARGRWG